MSRDGQNFFASTRQKLKLCGIERSRRGASIPTVSALYLITANFPVRDWPRRAEIFSKPLFQRFLMFSHVFLTRDPELNLARDKGPATKSSLRGARRLMRPGTTIAGSASGSFSPTALPRLASPRLFQKHRLGRSKNMCTDMWQTHFFEFPVHLAPPRQPGALVPPWIHAS